MNKQVNKRKVLIMALVIIAAIIAAFLLLRGCADEAPVLEPEATPVYLEDDGQSTEGEAQRKDRDEILDELEKQQLVVTDKLSSNISFSSGEAGAIGEWVVENPQENEVVQQAEVYLDDVLIAKTTPIYPNQHITGVTLLSDVEAGEHDVTAYLNYYDTETKAFISKAGYNIHLTVR